MGLYTDKNIIKDFHSYLNAPAKKLYILLYNNWSYILYKRWLQKIRYTVMVVKKISNFLWQCTMYIYCIGSVPVVRGIHVRYIHILYLYIYLYTVYMITGFLYSPRFYQNGRVCVVVLCNYWLLYINYNEHWAIYLLCNVICNV